MKRFLLLSAIALCGCGEQNTTAIESIETPYTITNVRTAQINDEDVVIGSGYDGELLCYGYDGTLKWENKLSGFMNHDIFCGNLDSDKSDEILVANSDGSIYAVDHNGKTLWQFRPNEAPMSGVTIVHKDGKPFVAAGGYDTNFYYLTSEGKEVGKVASKSYSVAQIPSDKDRWGGEGTMPPKKTHSVNFMKSVTLEDGSEVLVVEGTLHSLARKGQSYLFRPLETKPYKIVDYGKEGRPIGSASIDYSDKKNPTLLYGTSTMLGDSGISLTNVASGDDKFVFVKNLVGNKIDSFGYRVTQAFSTPKNDFKYLILLGSRIVLADQNFDAKSAETLVSRFSYNDGVYNDSQNKMILASAQSGGNCIHIIDLNNPTWKEDYQNLQPKGNITSILDSHKETMTLIEKFEQPQWEKSPRPIVYFMSDGARPNTFVGNIAKEIHEKYNSPIFLRGGNTGGSENPKLWRRDTMRNEFYRVRRESRQKYQNTQEKILKNVKPAFGGDSKGVSMWGGHGNDPYYYSLETKKKILDFNKDGQHSILIFPEFETRTKDFAWMLNDMVYPLADHARLRNSKLYIRSKHAFWFGTIYLPFWKPLTSGKYADVFVPSMEETTDKSMELSYSARMGIWASGAVDSWGTRGARDNTSYNRLRQHSHQMIPNHFLRMLVFHISSGAQYIDNFGVNQEYMNILWQMIAKGVLYVPTKDQIVSFNPVRLNIIDPDEDFLDEGNDVKWTTFYSAQSEAKNRMVFSHLNGTWPGAPLHEWDFSAYAAGVNDRRLNFLAPYNNGLVMITQPDDKKSKYRKPLEQNINPFYRGKMVEFFSDGKNYYSDAKKTKKFDPTTYYKEVEKAIEKGAKEMPLTVKGKVAWVAAQSAPKHIRLTVIDGGYVNPSDKEATIELGKAKVKSITNLLTGEKLKIKEGKAKVKVDCGMFTFLDLELTEKL